VRLFRAPGQIVRLAILFVIVASVLISVRRRFVPPSFGELGHYRADAIKEVAAQPIKYAGGQACVDCHAAEAETKNKSYHRGLACEVCHGPSHDHAEDPISHTPAVPRKRGEICLYCHAYLPARPTGFPQIDERAHNPMEPCIKCHNPHDPSPPAAPESCSACHGQIAKMKAVSHHASLSCERCHEAPTEHLINPRAHLPKKPTQREFCGQCHATEAKDGPEVPRIDLATHGGRYLCWQCHYPHFPES